MDPIIARSLKWVEPEWRDEFQRLITNGDASEAFLKHLDDCPKCQKASDHVISRMFSIFREMCLLKDLISGLTNEYRRLERSFPQ